MNKIEKILVGQNFIREEIVELLQTKGEERISLLKSAQKKKDDVVGKKVFFRGLVEFSNICSKDCLYCGIRKSNNKVVRYNASDDEILAACRFEIGRAHV